MLIQNFYIDCEIDGYKSRLTGGPHNKDGGFNLTIYQRSKGEKITALKVRGTAGANGKLSLDIWTNDCSFPVSSIVERIVTKW